jgi:cytochrome c-type biogenesis protein CcmF
MSFIGVVTTWPLVTEFFQGQQATIGPPFYNRWMAPIGLIILALMGAAPLFGWRKTSDVSLKRAFTMPTIVMLVVMALHIAFGKQLGFPAYVIDPPTYSGVVGKVVQQLAAIAPLVTVALVFFNFAVVYQEFARGVGARRRNSSEGFVEALFTLVRKSRRRYGGYIVHIGIGLMYLGFCGKAWEIEKEASLLPQESTQVGNYKLTYKGSRREVDQDKQMIFADLDVEKNGRALPQVHPAKFIYNQSNMGPTTEVSQLNGLRDDLYVVVGTIDPDSKRATFRIHVNPLVLYIWIGVFILVGGAAVSLWPDVSLREVGAWSYARAAAGLTSGVMFALIFASSPAGAVESSRPLVPRSQQALAAPLAQGHPAPRANDFAPLQPRDWSGSGAAVLGGLLLGAAVACSRSRRGPEQKSSRS